MLNVSKRFMAQYPLWGVDGSAWMDRIETAAFPDMSVLANLRATILGWKVTQGEGAYGFEDRTWRRIWQQVRKINAEKMRLYRLPFHFWDYAPGHYSGSAELFGSRQARYCWNALKTDPGEVPLHLDVEPYPAWGLINRSTAGKPMQIALGFLKEYDQLAGSLTPIYTSPGMLPFFGEAFKDRGLWLAWYNEARTWASIDAELKKNGWRGKAWLWQHASDGDLDEDGKKDGIKLGMEELSVDLNVCRLTIEEFSQFCGAAPMVGSPAPVEQAPDNPPEKPSEGRTKTVEILKVMTADGLNIRNQAGKAGAVTGYVVPGKDVEVLERIKSGTDTWARVGQGQFCAIEYGGGRYLG